MKKAAISLGAGIILAIALLGVQELFNIDRDTFLSYYLYIALALVVGWTIFKRVHFNKHVKKMKHLQIILEQGDTDTFISEMEEALLTIKGKYLITVYKLNLSTGYCDAKQYEKAKDLLEGMPIKSLSGTALDIYLLNLCAVYFYLNDTEKAMDIYNSNTKMFKRLGGASMYSGNVAVIGVFALIEQGYIEEAQQTLASAKEININPRLYDDFKYLEEKIAGIKGDNQQIEV